MRLVVPTHPAAAGLQSSSQVPRAGGALDGGLSSFSNVDASQGNFFANTSATPVKTGGKAPPRTSFSNIDVSQGSFFTKASATPAQAWGKAQPPLGQMVKSTPSSSAVALAAVATQCTATATTRKKMRCKTMAKEGSTNGLCVLHEPTEIDTSNVSNLTDISNQPAAPPSSTAPAIWANTKSSASAAANDLVRFLEGDPSHELLGSALYKFGDAYPRWKAGGIKFKKLAADHADKLRFVALARLPGQGRHHGQYKIVLVSSGLEVGAEASATASVGTATASTGGDNSNGNDPTHGGKPTKKNEKTGRRKRPKNKNRGQKEQRKRARKAAEKASYADNKAPPPADSTVLPANAGHVVGAAPNFQNLSLHAAIGKACNSPTNPVQHFLRGAKSNLGQWKAFKKKHHHILFNVPTKDRQSAPLQTTSSRPSDTPDHQSSLDAAVSEGLELVAMARRHLVTATKSLPPLDCLLATLRDLPHLPGPSRNNAERWCHQELKSWTEAVRQRLQRLVGLAERRIKQDLNHYKASLNTDALVTAIPDLTGIYETAGGNRYIASAAIWSQQCRSAAGTNTFAVGYIGTAQQAEIENCPYFHGDISREDAVTVLRSTLIGNVEGRAFLLRLRLRRPDDGTSQKDHHYQANWRERTSKPPPSPMAAAFAFSPAQKLGVSKVAAGNAPLANTTFSFAKAVKVDGEDAPSVDNQPTNSEGKKPVSSDLVLMVLDPQNSTHDEDARYVREYPVTYRPKTTSYDECGGWKLSRHLQCTKKFPHSLQEREWQINRTKPTLTALTDWLRQRGAGAKIWKGIGDPANRTSKLPPSPVAAAFASSPAQKLGLPKVAAGNAPLANTTFSFAKAVKANMDKPVGTWLEYKDWKVDGAEAVVCEVDGEGEPRVDNGSQQDPKAAAVKAAVQPGDAAAKLSSGDSGPSADAAGTSKKRGAETDDDELPSTKVKFGGHGAPARPPTPLRCPLASSPDLGHTMPKTRTAAQLKADRYKRLILISWEREAAAAQSNPAELNVVRAHVSTSTGRWEELATEADILSQMKDKHIGPSVVIEGPNLKASEVQQLVLQGIRDSLLVSIHRLEMRLADGEDQPSFVELPPKFGIEDVLCQHEESVTLVGCGKCGKQATAATCKLLRCSACKIQKYCSKECQVQDWHWHKTSCTASRETLEISLDPTVSQITRLVDLSRSPFWQGSVSAASARQDREVNNAITGVNYFDIIVARFYLLARSHQRHYHRAVPWSVHTHPFMTHPYSAARYFALIGALWTVLCPMWGFRLGATTSRSRGLTTTLPRVLLRLAPTPGQSMGSVESSGALLPTSAVVTSAVVVLPTDCGRRTAGGWNDGL